MKFASFLKIFSFILLVIGVGGFAVTVYENPEIGFPFLLGGFISWVFFYALSIIVKAAAIYSMKALAEAKDFVEAKSKNKED